ncbi:MAG: SH3 domain-containing protein [Pseudodonghicola sp.]|nr:SH3 domain-containing protein [Pseudodonghicola sp.]
MRHIVNAGGLSVNLSIGLKRAAVAAVVIVVLACAGQAQQTGDRGAVTNLPLPRFVSLKTSEGNVRRGPSLTHRIDWVFKRRDMPLQVTAEHGHWRRVQDRDGAGGWVHYALLSGVRTVLVEQDMLPVHSRPDSAAPVAARFELGVVARLGKCTLDWCRISAGGYRGWAQKTGLWGVTSDEIRD